MEDLWCILHTETKTKLRNPSQEEIEVYNAISGARDKSGVYHKTCFHLHTPASFDYRLKQEWTPEQYLEIQDAELLKLCQEERIILPQISIDDISEDDIRDYSNKKEFLSYLLLAERLIINNIEVRQLLSRGKITFYSLIFMEWAMNCKVCVLWALW